MRKKEAPSAVRRRNQLHRRKHAALMKRLKGARGSCLDCGEIWTEAKSRFFHWDHRDPADKLFNIGRGQQSLLRTEVETRKCDMRCAPCHRVRSKAEGHHSYVRN